MVTDPAAPPADFSLDACEALRADLAARAAAAPAAPAGRPAAPVTADVPVEDPASDAVAPAAWLPMVTTLERAARLPARDRPAHFRRVQLVWDAAADACRDPRYAALGARLARWRTRDPRLPVVKETLWALERPEAAGYTRLALSGYAALLRLLPANDARRGYVLAQSARAVRTLGDVSAAVERYTLAERLGTTHRDRWLRVRSAIGLAATYHHLGNYPATRAVLTGVLAKGSPDPRFTAAAHHGLVLGAMAASDWDTAFAHGAHLLRAGRRGVVPRIDVLLLMAGLCRDVGRYRAAVAAARAALPWCVRPEDPLLAHKIVTDVAIITRDETLGREHAAALRAHVQTGGGPFEDARGLHTLARAAECWGTPAAALRDARAAHALAQRHGYHELAYHVERTIERLSAPQPKPKRVHERPEEGAGSATYGAERAVPLGRFSQRMVARLTALQGGSDRVAAVV